MKTIKYELRLNTKEKNILIDWIGSNIDFVYDMTMDKENEQKPLLKQINVLKHFLLLLDNSKKTKKWLQKKENELIEFNQKVI